MHTEEGGRTSNENIAKLDISVRNPVTHNTWEKGRYTDYEIAVQTNNNAFCLEFSTTRRRFSEFEWLKKRLKAHHPLIRAPRLPPKKFFGERFDPDFIAFRKKELEDYLHVLVKQKMYLSDVCLHLFLQTDLTTSEIDNYLSGKITADVVDQLWQAGGVKANCGYFMTQEGNEFEASVSSVNSSKIETSDTETSDTGDSDQPGDVTETASSSSIEDTSYNEANYPSVSIVTETQNQAFLDSQEASTKDYSLSVQNGDLHYLDTSVENSVMEPTGASSNNCVQVAKRELKTVTHATGDGKIVTELTENPDHCDIRDSKVLTISDQILSINGDNS